MPKILDIKDMRFGRLLVIERTKVSGARNVMWRCLCDCGNKTIAAAANIGKTTFSCGCLAKETAKELLSGNTYARTHNMSHTPEHDAWSGIQQRCYNPNHHKYPIYGGRGITVCKRWLDSFDSFYADMGARPSPKHSIDRFPNNDGNYEPNNCQWRTNKQQSRNRRTNVFVEIDGTNLCLVDWYARLGIPPWKATEMVRAGRGKYPRPPECATIEEAVRKLYRLHHG
jgi:hypothetical protein